MIISIVHFVREQDGPVEIGFSVETGNRSFLITADGEDVKDIWNIWADSSLTLDIAPLLKTRVKS